jgi:hypothetical protein
VSVELGLALHDSYLDVISVVKFLTIIFQKIAKSSTQDMVTRFLIDCGPDLKMGGYEQAKCVV